MQTIYKKSWFSGAIYPCCYQLIGTGWTIKVVERSSNPSLKSPWWTPSLWRASRRSNSSWTKSGSRSGWPMIYKSAWTEWSKPWRLTRRPGTAWSSNNGCRWQVGRMNLWMALTLHDFCHLQEVNDYYDKLYLIWSTSYYTHSTILLRTCLIELFQ